MPRSRLTSSRSRRQRLAAGAVLAASGLLGTYLAAIRPQPTYASPNADGSSQAFRSLLTPSALPVGCPAAPAGWDDTYVATVDALRTAITTADDSTFICVTESLSLTGGQLDVDDTTLTITGRDDSEVTIDLGGNNRFIDAYLGLFGPDDTLTVAHLTIENGNSPANGGAIRVRGDGALLVESSRFIGNTTTYGDGGAIWSDVPLEVRNSHFANNLSPDTGGDGNGGAIYAGRPLEVSGSSFTGNYSYDDGGAIFGDSRVTVSESYFTGNQAYDRSGGAIFASGALTVSESYFTGNQAYNRSGGAIRASAPSAISTSVFVNNGADRSGGAVYAIDSVSVEDCVFDGNDADSQGAALDIRQGNSDVSVITSSSFIFNGDDDRPTYGGGVSKRLGDLVISNSLFYSNYASKGGAVSLYDDLSSDDTITYTTIIDNYAATSGGGIFLFGSNPGVSVLNSILWANESKVSFTDDDSDIDANGGFVSLRNSTYTDANSISGITPIASVAGDPLLPQPGNNGGPVIGSDDSTTYLPTTIPGIGSPAIGIADPSLLPEVTVDQIGATRTSRTAGSMNVAPPTPPQPTFPPSAPLSVTGQAGSSSATVTWATPTSAGSFPITDYQAIVAPGGQTCLVQAPATRCTITGLTNGTTYTAIVRALNGAGWSTWSDPSEPFTPVKPVEKSILITGTRAQIDGRSGVRVLGETTGLVGATVQARVHLSGEVDYYDGSRRTVADDGTFTWQRFTNKKVYVYFRDADDPTVRSNRIIIPIR